MIYRKWKALLRLFSQYSTFRLDLIGFQSLAVCWTLVAFASGFAGL